MLQRAKGGAIRPISIGRALLAELDSQFDDLENGAAINPHYEIAINGGDATILSSCESAMLVELRHAIVNHAAIEGYPLAGDAVVNLVTDPAVKRGTCRVTPVLAATSAEPISRPISSAPSSPTTNAAPTTDVVPASVVLADGQRIVLDHDLIAVGRQSDCQVVIDDHNVSRHHAEIRRTTAGWVVTDRNSTNGTKVNGEKVANGRLLVDGDIVAFGSAHVRFENS